MNDFFEKILKEMTVEEICGQLLCYDIYEKDNPKEVEKIVSRIKPGGIFVSNMSAEKIKLYTDMVNKYTKIPVIVSADIENGPENGVKGGGFLPYPMAWGACNDEKLIYEAGKITARICRKNGIHWTFAPVVDLNLNFRSPETNVRAVSDDPDAVIRIAGAKKVVFEIFSLKKDLYELEPFKGDTHLHTTESDGLFTPTETVSAYYEEGFDYMAITDHHKYAGSAKMAALMDKIATHFKVYPGEEVHNRQMGYFHIINFGASSSVNEIINADPDGVFKEVTENAAELKKQYKLPAEIDEKELAFRLWVSGNIRKNGGVSVLCHPYWDAYGEYNMQTPMLEFLLKNGIFDALEVVDDDDKTGNGVNLQVAMYNDMRAKGIKIPIVGASDCHNVVSELFGKFYTYAFCKNVNDVKEAVKNLKSVAVERIGDEYRIYGEFRLVRYARFLTDNFYPEIKEIRKGTAAKIAEAIEKESAAIMSTIENVTEEYRKAFFGRK